MPSPAAHNKTVMEISIPTTARASEIFKLVADAPEGSILQCQSDKQFSLAKIALVKLQKSPLTIELLDRSGYALKTASSQPRAEISCVSDEMSSDQLRALKALESALKQCRKHGVTVVGFSDSLVGVPSHLGHDMAALSSMSAIELNTSDAYKGVDSDADIEDY